MSATTGPAFRRSLITLGLIALFSLAGYLVFSARVYGLGFPLDDAWIHQTYARNLALRGEWAFIPGQPSAGSTAPLWSALLAVGHMVGLGAYTWTYLLGWAFLWLTAGAGMLLFLRLQPGRLGWALAAGALLALDWRLVWAAGSGMETLLLGACALLALLVLASERPLWFALGLLIGLSVWIRPDGITLLGPAGLVLVMREKGWPRRGQAAAKLLLGVGLVFVPYLVFNRLLAGAWWPNTFFAKQAEYAELRQAPFGSRFIGEAGLLVVGAGILLLPGWLIAVSKAVRQREWVTLAGAAWMAGYLFLYAWRLPVTYQHGRYILPAAPVYLLLGMLGLAQGVQALQGLRGRSTSHLLGRVLAKAWIVSTVAVTAAFWVLGGRAYATDVAIIESEMVETARWVAQNTPPGSLVAAHDIGALGYFGNRPLIDLAGLISPEVIPFIRDEERMEAFLDQKQASYLVTFPGWYPRLVQVGRMEYQTGGRFSPEAGGENMAVIRWRDE